MNITEQIYNIGLEKFAGDETKAKEFTVGFLKEAFFNPADFAAGATKALGAGAAAAAVGLGIHGLSSTMSAVSNSNLKQKFETVLSQIINEAPLLKNADPVRVRSYGETVFKFAPHVAADPNLLKTILSGAIHGDGIDPMTIRTLADLETRYLDSRKASLFTPKGYV